MILRERIAAILKQLGKGIYEKEEAIRLALLTAVAGESIFLLGPPGVAKSLVARRLKFAFKDGKSFEYLMNKFSTPDEIFGPVSIKKLKDEDKYERLTDRYMPGASVVFLDEIWKAGPSIQNALLTILNEKIYRNGEQDIKVNIKGIIAASNELPLHNEGLEALWDRFLVRYLMTEIRQSGNFLSMITGTDNVYEDQMEGEIKITEQEMETWDALIDRVELPAEVLNTIQLVRYKLDEYDAKNDPPFRIYDRRWKKIVRLLRTSAFLNGRTTVDLMDCFLIADCLWGHVPQQEVAREIVAEVIRKHGYTLALNLTGLKRELAELEEEVKTETRIPNKIIGEELYLIDRQYYEVINIENYFEGKYVRSAEFEKLRLDDMATIGIYDDNAKLTYKVKAQKAKTENQIEIYHNANSITLPLKTHKVEKTNYLYKKPHPMIEKYWNQRIADFSGYVKAQREKLQSESPSELNYLKNNLFVDSGLSGIVEANMNEVINTLNSLELSIEKIRHYYTTL